MIRNVVHRHRPYQKLLLHLSGQRYLVDQPRGRLLLPESHHPDGRSHGLQLQPVHECLGNNSRVTTPVETNTGLHLPDLDPLPQMVDPGARWIRLWSHRNRKHPGHGDGPMQHGVMILLTARLLTTHIILLGLPVALQILGVPHADPAGLPSLYRRHPLLRRHLLELGAVLHLVALPALLAARLTELLGRPDRVDRRLLDRRLAWPTALPEAAAAAAAALPESASAAATG